jgi:PKHD-type hydroxylase
MLSDPSEYEGGELDLEFGKPNDKPRYTSFKLPKGGLVFFQSDVWHRVCPITSGVRKSLVAWFSGPPYI